MRRAQQLVRFAPLAAIVVGGLWLSLRYRTETPLWQAPDEPAHANYMQHLVDDGILHPPTIAQGDWDAPRLSTLTAERFPEGSDVGGLSYEDHQPPAYFSLMAALLMPFGTDFAPVGHDLIMIGCDGIQLSALQGCNLESMARLARLFTTWLEALAALAAFLALRSAFPNMRTLPLAATAFIAFLPMYAYMSAVVNNDALANAVMALALLAAVRRLAGRTTRRRYVAISGLIWALALLTKLTVYPVILALAAAEWLRTRREGGRPRDGVAPVAKSIALGLLVAAPWFIRNMRVYGITDPFGLAAHNRVVVGQPRTADWIAQHGWGGYLERAVVFTFDSFWGVFGWMSAFMDRRIYVVLALASAVMTIGFAGYVRRAWRAERAAGGVDAGAADAADVGPLQRDVLVVFALVVATTVGGYVWYNLTFVQHQGRYLFPALIPIACAAMLGIREWARWLARAVRRPSWTEPLATAGMIAFDAGLLTTSVWALIHTIPTLWPGP